MQEKTEVKVNFKTLNTTGSSATFESNSAIEEIKNEFYVDQRAKKRLKIAKTIKALLWVALIVVVVATLFVVYK